MKPNTVIKYVIIPQYRSGSIYLAKAGNLYKIGRSTSAEGRVKQLGPMFGIKPTILLTYHVPDYVRSETYLHQLFADKRVTGEWFRLDHKDLETISSYLERERRSYNKTAALLMEATSL